MTIRLRLTVLYAAAFFVAGAVLIGLMYFYLGQTLERRPGVAAQGLIGQLLEARGLRGRPEAQNLFSTIVSQAEQQRRQTMRRMLTVSLASLGVVGIAACGFGWLLAGRALQPLQQVTATARRVADRSLHERIGLVGPRDEIKDLADTFDAMLERLDRAFDSQRRFVANASHELRTPLTINRTLIEVALAEQNVPEATRRLGSTLLDVNERHERLIDGLLLLASSQGQLTQRSRVDLAETVARAVELAADVARQKGVEMTLDLRMAEVVGDPVLLERLAANLIDNAVRYNVEGGWVSAVVSVQGHRAHLSVENTGAVVPDTAVDGLFEPFRRLTAERTAAPEGTQRSRGAGLGLSIVRAIALAHGGDVRAVARPGGGLTVTFTAPVAQ